MLKIPLYDSIEAHALVNELPVKSKFTDLTETLLNGKERINVLPQEAKEQTLPPPCKELQHTRCLIQ